MASSPLPRGDARRAEGYITDRIADNTLYISSKTPQSLRDSSP